ncbi:hypothetical protein NL108_014387 [Boleophthalmus pectinirostris]|nr:hypothetical protein NL108_014387 [Boleophthalmus pectinirostris]
MHTLNLGAQSLAPSEKRTSPKSSPRFAVCTAVSDYVRCICRLKGPSVCGAVSTGADNVPSRALYDLPQCAPSPWHYSVTAGYVHVHMSDQAWALHTGYIQEHNWAC